MDHVSVLKDAITAQFSYLKKIKEGYFVDGTLGAGGHSLAVVQSLLHLVGERGANTYEVIPRFKFIGIDKDEQALKLAKNDLEKAGLADNFIFIHDDFKNIKQILLNLNITDDTTSSSVIPASSSVIPAPYRGTGQAPAGISRSRVSSLQHGMTTNKKINGALLDLGVSSMQLDQPERGFTFSNQSAPLDMRMDQNQTFSADDIINNFSQDKIEKILKEIGEERFAKSIARNIAKFRKAKRIKTVGELLTIIKLSMPPKYIHTHEKHFATNAFRAFRIVVNEELNNLDKTIQDYVKVLESGARMAVISFHSGEDRIVKNAFRRLENPCICPPKAPICICGETPIVKIMTKKPIIPSDQEINENPRSRSAKLRVAEKL